MNKFAVSPFGLALAGLAAAFCSSCNRAAGVESATTPAEMPAVAVARATTADLSRDMVLTAEFKPYQEIDVLAKVAGFVREIKVDVGDRVRQGQLLATLEIPEMTDDILRARAALDRARAEVARAKDELHRAQSAHEISHISYQRLFAVSKKQPGLVAQQEIDDAHGRDLVAEAQVSAAQSALSSATRQVMVNEAELKKVETMYGYTKVTAPFAGVVTKRFADTGSMIQAGTASQTQAMPVVRLSENSLLRLILPVPESAVPTVHIGQQVEVRVPTLQRSFPGKVARFASRVASATRTMDTEVDVPNPGLVLIPGMYAEVDLTLAHRGAALTIPVTAVDTAVESGRGAPSSGRNAAATGNVMVVTPTKRVEVRRIGLGLETANRVEVTAGLNEGDMVIIGSRSGLTPGQEVVPKVVAMGAEAR